MSVIISEGLRAISPNPFEVAKQTRAVLEPLFFAKITDLLALIREGKQSEGLSKLLAAHKKTDRFYSSEEALFGLIASLYESPLRSPASIDIGYEVILMPSANDDRILAEVFSADRSYRKALLDAGVYEEFGYWDHADEPEEVPAEEWLYRGSSWGLLITHEETPASIGLRIPSPTELAFSLWSFGLKY